MKQILSELQTLKNNFREIQRSSIAQLKQQKQTEDFQTYRERYNVNTYQSRAALYD